MEETWSELSINEQLLAAAAEDDVETVKCCLDKKADIDTKNKWGETALYLAVLSRSDRVVEFLLQHDPLPDLEVRDSVGATALWLAVAKGSEKNARLLLDKGAELGVTDWRGDSELSVAASHGDILMMKLLLDRNADVETKNIDGVTPLHCASRCGDAAAVELLLGHNADINARDARLWTALHYAASAGEIRTVQLLLERMDLSTIVAKNDSGETALHRAAYWYRVDVSDMLLRKLFKSRPDAIVEWNNEGDTALIVAADRMNVEGLQLLVNYEADIAYIQGTEDDVQQISQPVMKQVTPRQLERIIYILLQNQDCWEDLNKNDWEKTLYWAAHVGSEILVDELLECSQDRHYSKLRLHGPKAVLGAARSGYHSVVQQILETMMEHLNVKYERKISNKGQIWTTLHWAVNYKSANPEEAVEIIRHMLMTGADPDAVVGNGVSATDMARDFLTKGLEFRSEILGLLEAPLRVPRKPRLVVEPQPRSPKAGDVCRKFDTNIIDFFPSDGFTMERKSTVYNIIYGEGPDAVMASARRSWKIDLKNPLRWIHLPANNWIWAKDLVSKICYESNQSADEYTRLINFIERNWHEHIGQMPNRFVYPDLNFEHKDFRFGRATSIANLQRQSKKEIVEGKHITIEAVQGKRTEFKNIAGKAETSSITNANIWPPSGKSPIGSGGYEDCVDEAGKHSISSDDVNETGKGNSVRNFNEDGQPDYQTQKIREQLKEKKLQTDNKKGSQNEDGIPHLAGCKLAISMPFLTLQTVKSYRKLRQAIRLADEAQKLKGQGNFREARNSIFQSEIQHGCQLLKHTTKNCDKEKPDLIELSDLLEEVVKVSNIQIPNLKKLKKALKKIDRDDLPRKVLEWHERLQDAIDILEQPKDKDAHLKYSKYEALLEHYLTSSKEKGLHISRTIDQYFYSSLSDTSCRDIDQVIRRYQSSKLKERTQAKYKLDDDSNYNGDRNLFKIDKETEYNNHGKDQEFEMGMVDQLWMWVIDDRTIVTCFPQSIDKDTKSNRHDLLSRIRSHIHEERRPEISSIYHLASIITCLSVGLVEHCQAELPDGFESFFQIFTSSIAIVADKEVKRAEDFKKQLSRRDEGIHGLGLQEEIELLEEIKDIRDELSILQNICEEQQNILQKLFNLISRPPSETSQHIERDSVLSYYKGQSGIDLRIERIRKLQTDATTAYDSINHLLDLKQKDANIYEAVESRKQAEQTHVQAEQTRIQAEQTTKQGRTILVFTIVTIVFLPMSFLSSIFALNVRSFPHQNGDLSYPSKWIFSRIFGISAALAIPLILAAIYINKIWRMFEDYSATNEQKTMPRDEVQALDQAPDQTLQESRSQDTVKGRNLRVRFLLRNTSPSMESPC